MLHAAGEAETPEQLVNMQESAENLAQFLFIRHIQGRRHMDRIWIYPAFPPID